MIFIIILLGLSYSKLVLIGGALDDKNIEIYGEFIDLSTVDGYSYIGVITAASDVPV